MIFEHGRGREITEFVCKSTNEKSEDPLLIKVGLKSKIIDHLIFLRSDLCTLLLKLGDCSCRVKILKHNNLSYTCDKVDDDPATLPSHVM